MDLERFDRQLLLFGQAGQERIADTRVTIAGLGGTGSHIAQQLAFLGVRKFGLIDADYATKSSRNRLIGMRPSDVAAKTPKVIIAERMIREIEPDADITIINNTFLSEAGAAELARASTIFVWVPGPRRRSATAERVRLCLQPPLLRYYHRHGQGRGPGNLRRPADGPH
jgi:molybdopterin/thiamine biosynthesis adenylyltransferase